MRESGQLLLADLSRPDVVSQWIIIAALLVLSHVLAWRVKPKLENRARQIKGLPGVLRLIVILLRRLGWTFFVVLLTAALVLTQAFGGRENSDFISYALLLALAWVIISVVSHAIRSRALGRAFAIFGWLYVAATILGVTDDVAGVLGALGFQVGATRLTLLLLIKAVVLLGAMLWLAFIAGDFLDHRIQRSDELTPSLRVLIGKILRITLIVIAALVALTGLGVDLTAFTVLSGAIGVGIGFGLQKVVSNFISGIIILLDRSIKPGDTISVGETFGWIRELRARFVSVITRDGREYLIPNEDFITREVINWSFSDDLVRLDVSFGTAYSSNPHEVAALAIEAAKSVPRVVQSEQPVCWLTAFGDSSLDFVLRFWIRDPQQGLANIRGMVLLAIWDAFKEHGVSIPFPHRELILRTPIEIAGKPEQA